MLEKELSYEIYRKDRVYDGDGGDKDIGCYQQLQECLGQILGKDEEKAQKADEKRSRKEI